MSRASVLIIHNIMAPYRFPLFRALAKRDDLEVMVWFMSRSARNRRWSTTAADDLGFNYAVLPSIELNYRSADLFTYIINYTFPWAFARHHFDVLISSGWLDFACQSGFLASKLLRRKFIMWSESTAFEPSLRRSLAAPVVNTMVSGADACIAVGTRSREYLRSLGAREDATFTAYSTVDVAHFQRTSAAARPERDAIKQALGITRGRVILYCGQFIERKGLRHLVDAFARVKQAFADVSLVLVGYGPERAAILADAARLGMADDVHILDHVEVQDMPRMYALADIFVLPSLEETWGLVVNEAMACGLPVIVSERVGSSVDLVQEGRNGFVVPPADAQALASACLELLIRDERLAQFGACSAERIQLFTPERAAEAFAAAVRGTGALKS